MVGEVRGKAGPDREHPFGRGQEKFFWALVSAVSVFYIGCGINIDHGIESLLHPTATQPFTPLVIGLLLFALALESWTFTVAFREIGGLKGLAENRSNVTVLAVLLEDGVALLGILLTLLVAGISSVWGPRPAFDAVVAIGVGALLGVMALFLAGINRRLLIDSSDQELDRAAEAWRRERKVAVSVRSLVLDDDRAIVFVRSSGPVDDSFALGQEIKAHAGTALGKRIDAVYWKFMSGALPVPPAG